MSVLNKLLELPMRRVARFLAVIAIAMAAGHLVQTLAGRKPALQAQAATNLPKDIVQLSAGGGDEPMMVLTHVAAPEDFLDAGKTIDRVRAAANVAPVCGTELALQVRPAGMIGVVLTAPCRSQQRVVLHHAGLAITGKIDADGHLVTDLPALSVGAVVQILFLDGTKIEQAVTVPDVATLRRFGVQWQGAEAFAVHGFQGGADLGQPGDISATNVGSAQGGTMTVMGDTTVENPLLAQIYTYPSDSTQSVDVVLEAAVTQATCGHDLLGEAIFSEDGRATITDLTLAMPDCSGVGDFLVLKNLASDMKIAAN
jgi:hypothetical protein